MSRPDLFCIKSVLKNFAKFESCKFPEACNFVQKNSHTGVFLRILRNFHLSHRTPPVVVLNVGNGINIGNVGVALCNQKTTTQPGCSDTYNVMKKCAYK